MLFKKENNKTKTIFILIMIIILLAFSFILFKTNHKKDIDEGLTQKEISEMAYVDKKIEKLVSSDDYKNLSIEKKEEKVKSLLDSLIKEKYIKDYTYDSHSSMFSFEYACGVLGGVLLKDFDPMYN